MGQYILNMELSNNICSLCCRLQPKASLAYIQPAPEFLSLLLGPRGRTLLACSVCLEKVEMLGEWLLRWSGNIELLKQLEFEHEGLLEQQHSDSASYSEDNGDLLLSEKSAECGASEKFHTYKDITNLESLKSQDGTVRIDLNNEMDDIHHERTQCVPLNLVKREKHNFDQNTCKEKYQKYADMESREDDLSSPISFPSLPIMIPSIALQATESLRESQTLSEDSGNLSQEERRRQRNREASRRYREKARGDPELLRKMREQQNKRQKKYYARIKEKKATQR